MSVRFIWWNNEETGLNGSTAYVNPRASQQGVESPAGHQATDVYETCSAADFRLGLNTVQMTLGTVAELAGAVMP